MKRQLTNKDFFFCYNKSLANYLIDAGCSFVTIAKEPKNLKTFTLFYKTSLLENELQKYQEKN